MLHIVTIAVRQIIHAAFAIQTQVFSCKFCEHFKNNFSTKNIRETAFEPLSKYFVHFSFCKIILIPLGLYFLSEVLKTGQGHQQYHACSFPNKKIHIRSKKVILVCWITRCGCQVFCEKGFLKNLALFTGKHLHFSLFLIKYSKVIFKVNKMQLEWRQSTSC